MKNFFSSSFWRKKSVSTLEIDALHKNAADYFHHNFPNPERTGCPDIEVLRQFSRSGDLPGDELRNHLFSCSECFDRFREIRQNAERKEAVDKAASFVNFKPLVGAFAAIVLLVFGGILVWQWRTSPAGNDHASDVPAGVSQTDVNSPDAESNIVVAGQSQPENKQVVPGNNRVVPRDDSSPNPPRRDNTLIARNETEIRIDRNSIWRGTSGEASKPILLAAKDLNLKITLPGENPDGKYDIFVTDEFGKVISEKKQIVVKKGRSSTRFDFAPLTGKQRHLCFAVAGEVPDCIVIDVGEMPKRE